MGFSIGQFIGAVAPFVGGAIAGPIGAVLGAGIGAGFRSEAPVPARAVTPQRDRQFPASVTSVVPTPVRRFTAPPFRTAGFSPTVTRGIGAAATAFGLGGAATQLFGGDGAETVSQILAEARLTFGRGVTKNKIIAAAKACGIEAAAATFGISTMQVCRVIVAGGTRRRRGISAADIRRTRRTLRTVKNIRADLKSIRL